MIGLGLHNFACQTVPIQNTLLYLKYDHTAIECSWKLYMIALHFGFFQQYIPPPLHPPLG